MNKLDKIKKELGDISPWPWGRCMAIIRTKHAEELTEASADAPNNKFIAKSPERITLLIDLVEKSILMANYYRNYDYEAMKSQAAGNYEGYMDCDGRQAKQYLSYVKEKVGNDS